MLIVEKTQLHTNSNLHMTYKILRVVEYSDFFPKEDSIDIQQILKTFERNTLVRLATLLSLHYGNMYFPSTTNTWFSIHSKKYINYLNDCCLAYFHRIGLNEGEKVMLSTFRTSLELWRNIFAIKVTEFLGTIPKEDEELMLFKVIITLNEKIMSFSHSVENELSLEKMLFLNSFITNDCNNYDFKAVMQAQMYYFMTLIKFIPNNVVLTKATTTLFDQWGIKSWKEYYATILFLAHDTEQYRIKHENGVPIIKLSRINDQTGFFSPALLDSLSIDEDAYIPYYDEMDNPNDRDYNVDYRTFRSKPIVKFKDGSGYVVINIQLLCERLFNSLYFDFSPLINGKKGSVGKFDYNKDFIEKVLFRKTLFKCFDRKTYTFPSAYRSENIGESLNEPDFYARKNDNLLILECKAIKMNGDIRDKGDYEKMLKELYQKIVMKTYNIDPTRKKTKKSPEPIGLGQLARHIDSIEEDTFQWDSYIPDDVAYYPILVFEDVRLLQPGFLKILNDWFKEVVGEFPLLKLNEILCRPVMAVSINTLFLYDNLIKSRGLANLIDSFLCKEAKQDAFGNYTLLPTADFDAYLRSKPYNKSSVIRGEIMTWLNR